MKNKIVWIKDGKKYISDKTVLIGKKLVPLFTIEKIETGYWMFKFYHLYKNGEQKITNVFADYLITAKKRAQELYLEYLEVKRNLNI